jgi:hypothetical protein
MELSVKDDMNRIRAAEAAIREAEDAVENMECDKAIGKIKNRIARQRESISGYERSIARQRESISGYERSIARYRESISQYERDRDRLEQMRSRGLGGDDLFRFRPICSNERLCVSLVEALGAGVAGLALTSGEVKITAKNQGSGSTFCNTPASGFGHLPISTKFLPDHHPSFPSIRALIPSEADIKNATPLRSVAVASCLQSIKENVAGGIHPQILTIAQTFGFAETLQTTLKSRGLEMGISSVGSYEDMHIHTDNDLYPAVMEIKGSEASILPALAQAAVIATNFCMGLLARGVPTEKCVVAVVACNGINMCFGVTYLLDAAFPTFLPISGILDLTCEEDCRLAAAHLRQVQLHCEALGEESLSPVSNQEMTLSTAKYFIKTITPEVFGRGFGLFTSRNEATLVHEGLDHMIFCLNRLYHSAAKDVAEYPLSLRSPDNTRRVLDEPNAYATPNANKYFDLIYRNLTAPELGFRVGTPNRLDNEELYNRFVVALDCAVRLVHDAGVLHVDLYASNVMWRLLSETGVVEIKLIDWDAAHCMHEGAFSGSAREKLRDGIYRGEEPDFAFKHDLRYLNVYKLPVRPEDENCWRDLCSEEKQKIDLAFLSLMQNTFGIRQSVINEESFYFALCSQRL